MTPNLRDVSERRLSPAELDAYIGQPVSDDERVEVLALRRWFMGRYPAAADRLAYVRRTYARWRRTFQLPER